MGIGVAVLLIGCAAQTAFRDGKALMAQGDALKGLSKLEEAIQLDPVSAEYRITYAKARDAYVQRQLELADAARAASRYDEAERAYRDVLMVRAQQDRALTGLRQLDQQRRWEAVLKDAEQAIARKDWEAARTKLRLVLVENPRHAVALKLLLGIEHEALKSKAEPSLASAYRQPISIEFKEVPLRTLFEVISRTARLNFVFDKEVKTDQRTSIYLRNSTVEAAISWLLITNQLEQRVLDGNTVLIYPATTAKQKEYQPLTVKSFYLANAEAKNVASALKTLLKSKDVVVDDKINLVVMRDSPEAVRLAEKIVALHDVPEPEVMLEVEILEVKRSRLLDLGVRWPDQVGFSLLPPVSGGTLTLEDLRNPTRASVGVSSGPLTVNAKKQDSDTNLLANPRIRARNREKAKILIGERVPNITTTATASGFVSESVNYVEVGLKLEVEPTIHVDNEVAIKVALEVSNIISQQQTKAGSLAYQLGTRTAQTMLRLKDGENQVLAGLINDEDRRTAYKVPGIGELPIVGRLFGSQADDSNKTEIILSITPRILRSVQPPDANVLEFESGTEASLRSWPSDLRSGNAAASVTSAQAATAAPPQSSPATQAADRPATAPSAAPGAVATTTAGSVAGQTLVRWEGPTQVRAGESFTVLLTMQSEQPVGSIPMVLDFDPKVLQVVSVGEGGFLREGGAQTTFTDSLDPSGKVSINAHRSDGKTGATTPGVLMTLALRVLPNAAAPDTRLRLVSASPTGPAGQSIVLPLPAPHVLSITR